MRDASFARPALPQFLPPQSHRTVAVLGSTGSIGTQALELMARNPERFSVGALAAGNNWELLAEQAVATRAPLIGLANSDPAALEARIAELAAQTGIDYRPQIICGEHAAAEVAAAEHCNVLLNGMTGSIGLLPTLAGLESGKLVALANKESLIVGGALVKAAAAPGQLIPVDSEHSAIAQCLWGGTSAEVRALILTASGGPFRGYTAEQLAAVSPADALDHPVWKMGKVITTNSATLVNKALEVVEAHLLFDVPLEDCRVVVHPEHLIHSMVEFTDGAVLAQISQPDMRLPIALGIGWPERIPAAVSPLSFAESMNWHFEPVDHQTFPAITLARQAAASSATHMAVYNAANEEAVHAFHDGLIKFPEIVATVTRVVEQHDGVPAERVSLDDVLAAERWARTACRTLMGQPSNPDQLTTSLNVGKQN
ncbi:1-deoxy-D-xylulose-5-phosphate reductoisomerase [Micrococcoides hystricis]|uniref:1-deoxy-D-xylulose 5-phosphate reductoisomerase n=1 Tax=Micrococcoides hystricis TaxID=1572761 RepID=A0ABV6P8Q6_9MICC